MEGCRGISSVDDVTWVVERDYVLDLTMKLGKYAEKSLIWAEGNAVRFETSKMEALLFTRSKKLWSKTKKRPIQVGSQQVFFAKDATR